MTISGFRSFGEHFVSESKADNAGNHEVQKEANRGKFGEIQNIQDHKNTDQNRGQQTQRNPAA